MPEPVAVVPDEFAYVTQENVVPTIRGTLYEDYSALMANMDVCLFTENKDTRPWLGRVLDVFPETQEFKVHWYEVRKPYM